MKMLDQVSIRVSPFSNRVVLARFGKGKFVASETRDVMSEFLQALVQYAFDGRMPEPGEKIEVSFGGGAEQFTALIARAAE